MEVTKIEEKMGLARQALDAYLLKLNTYPLRMQLMTGTMIGYAGDAIAQAGLQSDIFNARPNRS